MRAVSSMILAATALFASITAAKISNAAYFYNRTRPLVIAHRGASGQFPEHSVGSYSSAYYYGADYVEIDLQITQDGHIVTNHDPCLRTTTNVDQYDWLFGDRKSNYVFPPYTEIYTNDYLIHNFTLQELKQLRRKARYPTRN
jgi:glycerophosphoryl diester phosphodiesterase